MDFLTSNSGFRILLSLNPAPATHLNSCNYGGDIEICFDRNGQMHSISFIELLGKASGGGELEVDGKVFLNPFLEQLKNICWDVLYANYGIFPPVFEDSEERDRFFSSKHNLAVCNDS